MALLPVAFRAAPQYNQTELEAKLGLYPGAVSPLGALNTGAPGVSFFLDEAFREPPGLVGVHPNDNTATVWLRAEDLAALLRDLGCAVAYTPL